MQLSLVTRQRLEARLGTFFLEAGDTPEGTVTALTMLWAVCETRTDWVNFLVDNADVANVEAESAADFWEQGKLFWAAATVRDEPLNPKKV